MPDVTVCDKAIKGGPTDQGFDYYFGDGTINFPPFAWIEYNQFIAPPVKEPALGNHHRNNRVSTN